MTTVVAKLREVETVPRSNGNCVATTRFDERTPAARRRWYWHQSHNDVIQKLLPRRARARKSSTSPAITTKRRDFDGVVCGHIHKAEIREIDGVLYCNDGDWVESLTALAETFEGELMILRAQEILTGPAAPGAPAPRSGREPALAGA